MKAPILKEHPIIFSSEMVRAILEGHKTQTRRVIPIKLQACYTPEDEPEAFIDWCKYGHVGDLLWVRETWTAVSPDEEPRPLSESQILYKATDKDKHPGFMGNDGEPVYTWRPSIHMPRSISRITLEIVNVRVERIQDITEQDAKVEGVTPSIVGDDLDYLKYRAGFQTLWNRINDGPRGFGWDVNPWIWVIEFKRIS